MPSLQLEQLQYGRTGRPLNEPLTLRAEPGEVWAVLGENGVGKSTLLLTLARILPPLRGRVHLDGVDLARCPRKLLAQRLGVLLQQSFAEFPFTVSEAVMAGRYAHRKPWQAPSEADREAVQAALAVSGLAELSDQSADRLSGGEQRRLAIATTLAQDAGVYLLDEPVNHLDLRHQAALMQHFCRLAREHQRLVILSVHDINLAARHADKVLLLYPDGRAESGSASELLVQEKLEKVFRQPLEQVGEGAARFWMTRP